MCDMYRSSPFCSALNTSYITGLDMCEVCTEAVHSVALWTRVTSQVWTCVKYVPKQSIPKHLEHELHHRFGHVWSMYRSSPFRSTLNTSYITGLDMWSMYRISPFRSTLNTSYITGLDMCEVCTEAVHSVAPWTRVTSQVWTCVTVCNEAVHSVALWTRVTSKVWTSENEPFYTYGFQSVSKNMSFSCDKKSSVSKNKWVFPEKGGTPQIMDYYKPSILGFPYFWKHPNHLFGVSAVKLTMGPVGSLLLPFSPFSVPFSPPTGQSSEKQLQVLRNTSNANYYVASSIFTKIYRIHELQSMETSTFQILSRHDK